ncbi:uncharacterized protein [Dermacentor albipictus]|uniref:uncharacterized protein isoform X2 n=1 Tax=Dermacentor albipictus TaxID=60249 RepID=UPI0038FBF335
MEESAFQSQITKTSGSMSLSSAAETDNSVSGPRVAALAVIMCFCLMAMACMVVAIIITTSDILGGGSTVDGTDADINSDPLANPRPSAAKHPIPATQQQISSTPAIVGGGSTVDGTDADINSDPLANPRPSAAKHPMPTTPQQISSTPPIVKEIICTVSDTASSESMYPPDKYCDYLFYSDVFAHEGRIADLRNNISWNIFRQRARTYKIMKLGISFHYEVEPYHLDGVAGDLSALRKEGIKHYGLLTVWAIRSDFSYITSYMKALLEKLKQLQGGDQTAKTVIAIGCEDYSGDFFSNFTATLTEVANTWKVDIVIAISSMGWYDYEDDYALPPTVLTSMIPRYKGLLDHWHIVSPRANYTRPSIQTGLSFDLATLQCELVERAPSLNESLFRPCELVERTSRNVLCANGDFRSKADNYLGDQVAGYGVLSDASKVVVMSEYNDSVAFKFQAGFRKLGLRQRTAWLFYNVHLQDFKKQCPEPPYTVIRLFCLALKGEDDQRCQ